jgi:hypothetical protein
MSHMSVQTQVVTYFKLTLLRSKEVELPSPLSVNKPIVLLQFVIKTLCSDIWLFIFISTTYIIKFSIYLCYNFIFVS